MKYWDDYANTIKNDPIGASGGRHLVEIENNFILEQLKKRKFNTMLEIGCGNGQRTTLFSKYVQKNVLGIDYSKNMIREAKRSLTDKPKSIQKKIVFQKCNVFDLPPKKFDVIISCRCFINLSTHKKQVQLFRKLYDHLNSNGSLIIAEISLEGMKNLNKIRKLYGLPSMTPRWHNLHINEKYTFPKINSLFKIKRFNRAGPFYYISRVLHPAFTHPDQPNSESKMNEIALITDNIFNSNNLDKQNFEQFGAHLLIHFIKK